MDSKDFRLLVALNEDARQSLQALGRRVSLSAPAVRERLHRLEELGILQGYWLSIDPGIFGRQDLLVSFGEEWTRDEATEALGAPDVAWVAWKVDGGMTVQVWPRDAELAVADLRRFLGRQPKWHGVSHGAWTGSLSRLEWRVLDALVDDPVAPVERLSAATGLSPKTVRKHLNDLRLSEAIFVVPQLGFLKDSGDLVYNLVVSGTAPFRELHHVIRDAVLIHELHEPPTKYLFCRADSLGDLTATMHTLERLPGVSSVQVSLNREMLIGTAFLHRLVRERIETVEKDRRR